MTLGTPRILSLSQISKGQDWRLTLAHDRADTLLIWTTRGQGRLLLDGQRRGVGTHNAIYIPAQHLFSLDLGRQGVGQVVVFPPDFALALPNIPRLLRIRDAGAMNDLTALLEAAGREQMKARALHNQALDAYGNLIAIWLQRQLAEEEHAPARRTAGIRLTAAYCARITTFYHESMSMADHAEALGVTPTHLSRACKEATGKTAAELLTERILYEARCLLVGSTAPAQDIARHLGFGSAAYFTRFMQQHTKFTPTELRRAGKQVAQAA
jgi:AraC family transcriptional activator of pobA